MNGLKFSNDLMNNHFLKTSKLKYSKTPSYGRDLAPCNFFCFVFERNLVEHINIYIDPNGGYKISFIRLQELWMRLTH
jgi:hypothetical protein